MKIKAEIKKRTGQTRDKEPRESFARSWLHWQEWLSLLLLMVTLGIVMRCIEKAEWLDPQPSLILILGLAIFASLLAVKLRLPAVLGLLAGIISGVAVTVWQVSHLIPTATVLNEPGFITPYLQLWESLRDAKPSESNLYFAVFIIFLAWTTGFISGWFVLKRRNAWVAVILGAAAILLDLSFVTEDYYRYFFYFLFAALILVSHVAVSGQYLYIKRSVKSLSLRGLLYQFILVLCLSSVIITGAWMAPPVKANSLQTMIRNKIPWNKTFDNSSVNLFNALEPVQSTIRNSDRNDLAFSGIVDTRDDVLFTVISSKPYSYWRTRRYEIYNSWGWSSKPAGEPVTQMALDNEIPAGNQVKMNYTVINKVKTDIVLTAGEFISASVPVLAQPLAKLDTPGAGNTSTVTMPRLFNYNESYTVTSALIQVSPADLALAGQKYPEYISHTYLQLPASVTPRVRQLARTITTNSPTPIDKVTAVIDYLKKYKYFLQGTSPPDGVDGVDNFLFAQQKGNCTNFTSAAVVLLRSIGIPARLDAGYLSTEWNAASSTAIIRAKGYHAWPEIYFPGFGWIPFEATPSFNSIPNTSSNIDNELAATAPSSTPVPSTSAEIIAPPTTSEAPSQTGALVPVPDDQEPGNSTPLVLLSGLPVLLRYIGGIGVILFVVVLLVFTRRRRSQSRNMSFPAKIYGRMCFYAGLLRMHPLPTQTPLEYAAQLTATFPGQSQTINDIAWMYMRSEFGGKARLDSNETALLHGGWRALRGAFLRRGLLFRRRS